MIHQLTLLQQIEQLIQKAKQNPTDANVREQLTAVRALCDVVLQSQQTEHVTTAMNYNSSIEPVQVLQQRVMPKRAEIEQQNDSIFDF